MMRITPVINKSVLIAVHNTGRLCGAQGDATQCAFSLQMIDGIDENAGYKEL